MEPIYTQRLALRALRETDVDDIINNMNHKGQNTHLPGAPFPYEKKDAEWFINKFKNQDLKSKRVEWAIEYEGVVVGACNLHLIKQDCRNCCLGYAIGKPHAGQGFATEAATGLLKYAFEELNMHYVRAEVFEGNIGSLKVLEKIGFVKEGFSPEHTYHQQRYLDQHQLGIRKEEFYETNNNK